MILAYIDKPLRFVMKASSYNGSIDTPEEFLGFIVNN